MQVSINNETSIIRKDISNFLNLCIENTRLSETNVCILKNIDILSHETDVKRNRDNVVSIA